MSITTENSLVPLSSQSPNLAITFYSNTRLILVFLEVILMDYLTSLSIIILRFITVIVTYCYVCVYSFFLFIAR